MQEINGVQSGEVYVLGNAAMPGFYKIGYTTRGITVRINELSRSTSVPASFYPVLTVTTYHPAEVERFVHCRLQNQRHNSAREFFSFSSDTEAAATLLREVADSGVYQPVTPNVLMDASNMAEAPKPELTEEEKMARHQRGRQAIRNLSALLGDGGVA